MDETLTPFDVAEWLDSEEMILEYLEQVLADGDAEEIFRAIEQIERRLQKAR